MQRNAGKSRAKNQSDRCQINDGDYRIMDYQEKMQKYAHETEAFLKEYMMGCKPDIEQNLFKSMEYSLFSNGKRVRPVLMLGMYELCGGKNKEILKFAAAVEMIHTYSLIHDDLPCMDNDTFRRGKKCNHVVFGESTALLAGDALLTHAFELVSSGFDELDHKCVLKAINVLALCAGSSGMVSGQSMDLNLKPGEYTKEKLLNVYLLKTAKLIIASVKIGAILAGADQKTILCAENYGKNVGLVFQLVDDMLDDDFEKLKFFGGKKDAETFVKSLNENAKKILDGIEEDSGFLKAFSDYLVSRIA